jgi:molybdate/tungstate transport system substrate-binding protein
MLSRRHFLTLTTGALLAPGCRSGAPRVSVLAAGSLNNALENGLAPALSDVSLHVEAHGSAAAARFVAEGQRDPDVVTLADAALFHGPLTPDWYATFATNAMVLAYNADSDGGQRLAAASPDQWYRPLLEGTVRLGRTDPDQDPLGYRTLFMLELAARYYDVPDLADRILHPDQIYPETALISQFEVGAIDAAVAYRNMAVERDYDYVELPPEINLSDPAYADDWYATTAYTLPSGKRVTGGLIRYASTIRHLRDPVLRVFAEQCTGAYRTQFGLTVPDGYPRFHGSVPTRVATAPGFRSA